MIKKINQTGDTIVEVLLAMTVLSAVMFGSWAIINKATQISAAARQRVVMVNQLKEQAEIIKNMYASDSDAVITKTFHSNPVKTMPSTSLADAALTVDPCEATRNNDVVNGKNPTGAFYLDQVSTAIQPIETTKVLLTYSNAKVWVQLNDDASKGYIDFYIRACWETSDRQAEDSSQIVVRLNK